MCCVLSVVVVANDDLYTVQVPIYVNTDAGVEAAKRMALADVITKVTGSRSSLKSPHIQASQSNVNSYFDNISLSAGVGDVLPSVRLKFNSQAIKTLVEAAGLPIWDGTRPRLMVWLAKRDFNQSTIVGVSENLSTTEFIEQAKLRGLPLILPIMDLEDNASIQALDIETGQLNNIRKASQRYQADIILTGTLVKQSDAQWLLQGQILMPQKNILWQARALDMDALADQAMEKLAQELVKVYARQPTNMQTHQLLLQVNHIDNLQKYEQVQQELQQLSRIIEVQIHKVKQDQLTLLITHEGSYEHILANMDLIGKMVRISYTSHTDNTLPSADTNRATTTSLRPSRKTSLSQYESALNDALIKEQIVTESGIVNLTNAPLAVYEWR